MNQVAKFAQINEEKTNFDGIYISDDPRKYFSRLGELDYIIPHLAQPIIEQVIRARSAVQTEPVTVLDLGCSYGVNGALMKYAVSFDSLQQRYIAPALQQLSCKELLVLDQAYYRSWPRNERVRVIGLDVSEKAVQYAQQCGTVDVGLSANLEMRDPDSDESAALADVDLIVSTGCVGYVTSRTFERLAQVTRRGRPAWVVSFVLRMFPYDRIAATLDGLGLTTEKFEGATFVQRRFASREEMEAAVRAIEGRGIDSRGHEAEGLYHADLYISRPPEEAERCPIQKLVSVVSGANKPWIVGTNLLGSFGQAARRRAHDQNRRVTLAPAP
jgi:SAM-dependent methyltransferase